MSAAFAQLMRLAGRETPDFVTIRQEPPAMKTRFLADEAAAAAIAAGATLAADIWTLRSGEKQTVTVGTRERPPGWSGSCSQKFEDASKAPEMKGALDAAGTHANGFKKTRDGRFVFLHPSFPESTRRLLKVLDCPRRGGCDQRHHAEMGRARFRERGRGSGACAGLARTPEEWDASEQGRILAAHPVSRSSRSVTASRSLSQRTATHRCPACARSI